MENCSLDTHYGHTISCYTVKLAPTAFDLAWPWMQWGLVVASWLVAGFVVAVILFNLYKGLRFALYDIADRGTTSTIRTLDIEKKQLELSALARDAALVQPNANGLFPLPARLLDNPEFAGQALMLAAAHIQTRMPVALPANVPHTLTYAPHMNAKSENIGGQMLLEDQAAAVPPAKNFLELFNAGLLPSNGFLMGFDTSTGASVTAGWKDLYSALIGGASGSGKSTLIRSVLAQSAIQGGKFILLDKHYGSGDESLGESLRSLQGRMLCDVAVSETQMLDSLHYVRNIGQRRLSGADPDKTPVILIVDETTALLSRSNIAEELNAVLGMISQETRKVGVYSMCIGQNFKSDIMDTSTRNSFVSMISCRSRRDNARVMSGNLEFAKIAESLTIGEAVWMNPSGDVTKITVPNCTQEMVDVVAKSVGNSLKTQPQGLLVVEPLPQPLPVGLPASETEGKSPLSGKAMQIGDLFMQGQSKSQIIENLWGVTAGRAYQQASAEYDNLLRDFVVRAANAG